MDYNPNSVSFVFLVKFKCNRGHIHGLNWILAKNSEIKKNTLHGHSFFLFFLQTSFLHKERDLPCPCDSSIRCGTQLA
jgi:hypothetical protein